MINLLIIFRIFLVVATAIFMAYHTQIFISRIEPNFIFSWVASFIIEGFLLTLALSRTVVSRILIVPLFLISVVAATSSYIVQNENLLDSFLKNRKVIEQIETDLHETKKAYELGQRYTTKTLQRERQLSDELRAVLKGQDGEIALINLLIFFILVFVMQSVSVYTAMSLKSETNSETLKRNPETAETVKRDSETDDRDAIIAKLKEMKSRETLTDMSIRLGVSKATLSRVLSSGGEGISEEVFTKIASRL